MRNVSRVTFPIGEGAKALSDKTSWYSGVKFRVGRSYVGPVSREKVRLDSPERLHGIKPAALLQLTIERPQVFSFGGWYEHFELGLGGVPVSGRKDKHPPGVKGR